MLVVETVAKIRRLHRVQGKSIKAICRELGISRKVVRKVLRSGETEFRYSRARQPQPKLGPWQAELERLLEANEARPRRERLTLVRVYETLRAGVRGRLRRGPATCAGVAGVTGDGGGSSLRAAELRAGRGIPVRLEPRGRADRRHDSDRQSRACEAVPQPDAVRPRLSARDARDGV